MRSNREVVVACLQYVAEGAGDGFFKANPGIRDLVMQEEQWVAADRARVVQGLSSAMFEACDVAGLDRIALPAEFMGAAIAMFVSPPNWLMACHWVGAMHSNSVIMSQEEKQFDPVPPATLLSLLIAVRDDGKLEKFAQIWKNRMDRRCADVLEDPVIEKERQAS